MILPSTLESYEFGDLGYDNLKLAHEVTDAQGLADRFPHIRRQLDLINDIRTIGDEVNIKANFWEHRNQQGSAGKMVAMIPVEVWAMLVAACPAIDHDKKLFYMWLDKHPEYQAYSR